MVVLYLASDTTRPVVLTQVQPTRLRTRAASGGETTPCLPKTPSAFQHVANRLLRRTLESDPRHIRLAELRHAVNLTVEALGFDVLDETLPPEALDARVEAAREAVRYLGSRQVTKCHRALRKYWLC